MVPKKGTPQGTGEGTVNPKKYWVDLSNECQRAHAEFYRSAALPMEKVKDTTEGYGGLHLGDGWEKDIAARIIDTKLDRTQHVYCKSYGTF